YSHYSLSSSISPRSHYRRRILTVRRRVPSSKRQRLEKFEAPLSLLTVPARRCHVQRSPFAAKLTGNSSPEPMAHKTAHSESRDCDQERTSCAFPESVLHHSIRPSLRSHPLRRRLTSAALNSHD